MTTLEELQDSVQHFNLIAAEHNIASWVRKFAAPEPMEWQSAENKALRVLLDLATYDPQKLFAADGKQDAIANILARALGNCHRSTDYQTGYFASLAALAFAGAGNFPSASVYAKQARESPNAGPAEQWMTQFLTDPRLDLFDSSPPPLLMPYALLEDRALKTGLEEDFISASHFFEDACEQAAEELQPSDRYLLLLWTHVHQRLQQLSVARILKDINFPHQGYASAVVETTSPLFFPPQAQILKEKLLTQPGENLLISLPTSTGKSLMGEIALVSSLRWAPQKRWLAVYLAPYRALADQLHSRMRERLQKIDIACIKRRGDYLTNMSAIRQRRPTVVVATPEAFDDMLRRWPDLYMCLSACVFDEFHLIEQHQRGLRYEGLLGRLLHGAAGDGWPKIIALSAVVTDVKQVRRWLKIEDKNFAHSAWKPTGRRIAITSPTGIVKYYTLGQETPDTDVTEPTWQGHISLPYEVFKAPPRPTRDFEYGEYHQEIESIEQRIIANVISVTLDQHQRFQEPVLVLASSRADTRLIASQIKDSFGSQNPGNPAYALAQELEQRYPHLFSLRECLRHNVAYHNASLPDWVRRQLEALMVRKELNIVASTTTLAEGVDLPFRVVVMADWHSWLFGQRRPMPTLLFHNIAGRCGRAGEFSEGDTIIVDNPGREPRGFGERYQDYVTLYVNPKPFSLRSSVEWSIESGSVEIKTGTQAVLESQFTAYLAICGDSTGVELRFGQSLYAGQSLIPATYVENTTNTFTADMLAEEKHPVLERHSPLRLTDFGEIVLKTGLSPRSGVSLAHFFDDFEAEKPPSKGKRIRARHQIIWEPVLASIWEQIQKDPWAKDSEGYPWVREIEGYPLKGQKFKRGHPVTATNFPMVLMAWTSGVPMEAMAYLTLRDTGMKREAEEWLEGQQPVLPSWLEEWIEELVIFCNSYLGKQWAWVCRGAALIGRNTEQVELADEMEKLAGQLSYGVSQSEAQKLLRRGCPIDRARLDWIVREYKETTGEQELKAEPFLEWLREHTNYLLKRPVGYFKSIHTSERDISELDQFIHKNGNVLSSDTGHMEEQPD